MQEQTRSMLLELADLLDSLPDKRFDYKFWVTDWQGQSDLSCGATACAGGWATTLPSFRARGLQLHPIWKVPYLTGDRYAESFTAMARVLEIAPRDAMALFSPGIYDDTLDMVSPSGDATAKEVAQHIRDWIVAKEALEAKLEQPNND